MKSRKNNIYRHGSGSRIGILLTNLGTPDEPTPRGVRRYLAEFLADIRVVDTARWLWWLILHGVILRIRPYHVARAYQRVWTPQGSPLLDISQRQANAVSHALKQELGQSCEVVLGMRYGKPAIRDALTQLHTKGIQKLLVLPLYPQYSATTTASTFDEVAKVLKAWRWLPDFQFITHYHDNSGYIDALAQQIKAYWQHQGTPEKLLFSFHGLPKRYLLLGDPYHCQCHKTARLIAEQMQLTEGTWQLVFQSRFGREEWLRPYADHTLRDLGRAGIKRVDMICPGFAADCLETLDEIAVENRDIFLKSGGESYHYIPALNDSNDHIRVLTSLILAHLKHWPEATSTWESSQATANKLTRERALKLGAKD